MMTTIYEPEDNTKTESDKKFEPDMSDPELKKWLLEKGVKLVEGMANGTIPEKLPDEIEF